MKPSSGSTLRTHVEVRHFSPRHGDIEVMRDRLAPLSAATKSFPFANLQVTISFLLPAEEYYVKARLALPGRVLLTGEHDSVMMPPYECCVRKLVHKAELHRLRDGATAKVAAPISADKNRSSNQPNDERLRRAYGKDDCQEFFAELAGHRHTILSHVREWVRRRVGITIDASDERVLDDLVDEVMLSAFERYESRPSSLRIGDWIEILIDPALRSMLGRPDEPNEAVSYARSLREMRTGRARPVVDRGGKSPPASRTRWPTDSPRDTNSPSANASYNRD